MNNKLQNIYINYLRIYNESGIKPRIDEMLLIKLLQNINYFEPIKLSTKNFYKFYQRIITEILTNIKNDFKITKEDIEILKEENNILENNDFFLYEEVLEIFHTSILENKKISKEEIYYNYYYNKYGINLNDNQKSKKRLLSRIIKKEI